MDRHNSYAEEEENLAAKSAAFVQYLTRRGYLITQKASNDEAELRRQEFAKKAYHNTELLLQSYRDLVWAVESIPDQIASELEMPFATLDELVSRIDLELAMNNRVLEGRLSSISQSRMLIDRMNEAVSVLKKKPTDGPLLYDVIFQTYMSKDIPENAYDLFYKLHLSRRKYYEVRKKAIRLISLRLWYHCKPDHEGFSFGPDGSELPKKIRIPEFDDWTKLQFEDKMADDSDDVEKFNLSHIMYELTGCIMPRKMDRYIPALKILDRYGIRGKKTLPLLYCASALGEARHRSSLSLFDRLLESLENESEEEAADEQSAEEMKSQIKSLQAEVKRLKEASYEAGREVQEERIRYESLAQKAANDAQELYDLRELMFNQQNDLYDAQETAVDISFPYHTSRRIIVFGGHDSWCKEMKPKFPDIRFIDREMLPNPDMIRRADEIWIQTNALSHKHFYRIIDEVRKYNIPLRYFAYSGVSKCAEQIVREDKKD